MKLNAYVIFIPKLGASYPSFIIFQISNFILFNLHNTTRNRMTSRAELMCQVKDTKSKADMENTIDGYRRMIRQIEKFYEAQYLENDIMVRRPSTDELEIFLQHKHNLNPECNVESLSHFRSAVRKFADLSPHVEDYSSKELKDIKRFLGGMKNTNSIYSSEGKRKCETGKRHLKVKGMMILFICKVLTRLLQSTRIWHFQV